MDSLFNLKNKVMVVTGGYGLLGSKLVSQALSNGAKVIIWDQSEKPELSRAFAQLGEYRFVPCDITQKESIRNAVVSSLDFFGRIDVLVNNAYPRNQTWGRKFEDIDLSDWNENVAMHLGGYFNVAQQVVAQMVKQGGGSVINMCSIYGVVGPDFSIYEGTNMTMPAAYSAIKGGLITFTKYLATYFGKHQIRANAVSPGGIFDQQPDSFVERYIRKVPLGRMGTPDDIVGPVIFLASDAAAYITGQNLLVDGGWTSW